MPYIGNVSGFDTVDTEQIKDGSVTAVKVAADVATQSELDAVSTVANAALPKGGGTMTGDVILGDGIKLEVGAASGGDLQIFHDHSNQQNKMLSASLPVILAGTTVSLNNGANNQNMLVATQGGSVKLYNANAAKLETTSYGAYVTNELRTGSNIQAGAIGDAATNTITVMSSDKSYFQAKTQNDNENSALMFGNASNAYDGRVEYVERNMKFYTATVERMQIKSDGKVGIGTASPAYTLEIGNVSSKGWSVNLENNTTKMRSRASANDTQTHWDIMNGNGVVGTIKTVNSSTQFNTSSDYRLKENVDYTWDATTRLKQLKPARFNFIADEDNTLVDGFIAHEVSAIVPEAIIGAKDAVDDDDNPVHQGIDQSKLVPLLVKTIQELEARITALEA